MNRFCQYFQICFYDELACEWHWKSNAEMVFGLRDFNGLFNKQIDRFEGMHYTWWK